MSVLRYYLLTRGVTTPGDVSRSAVNKLVHELPGTDRPVLDPTLVFEPDSWVGFEPLDDFEIGDKYDDWVSTYYYYCDDASNFMHCNLTIFSLIYSEE